MKCIHIRSNKTTSNFFTQFYLDFSSSSSIVRAVNSVSIATKAELFMRCIISGNSSSKLCFVTSTISLVALNKQIETPSSIFQVILALIELYHHINTLYFKNNKHITIE